MNRKTQVAAGAVMFMSLFLTACGSNVPSDNDPKAYPSVTASASASTVPSAEVRTYAPVEPSATPVPTLTASAEEAKAAMDDVSKNPLGININEAFAKRLDPRVEQTFPAADFNTKEGVRFGLETLANVVNKKGLYEARDTTADLALLEGPDTTGRFEGKFLEKVKADIIANKKTLVAMNVDENGTYGTRKDGSAIKPVDRVPESTWDTPSVSLRFDEALNSNVIDVRGIRTMRLVSADGSVDIMTLNYNLSVVPSGDGWAVSDMGVGTFEVTRGNG